MFNSFWHSNNPWLESHKWIIVGIAIAVPWILYCLKSGRISLSSDSEIFSKADRPYDYWYGLSIYIVMLAGLILCLFL
jgi:hypothetical protein